jgi:hypothetical protein
MRATSTVDKEDHMSAVRKLDVDDGDAIATRLDELQSLVPSGTVVKLPTTKPDDGIDPNETSAWVWGWVH